MAIAGTSDFSNVLSAATQRIFSNNALRVTAGMDPSRFMVIERPTHLVMQHAGIRAPAAHSAWNGTDAITPRAPAEGNVKTYTQAEFIATESVGRLLEDFGMDVGLIDERAAQLGASAGLLLARKAFAVLTGGFADTGPDTKSLFATDHTAASGSRSNKGTTALSHASVAAAIAAMLGMTDYNGQELPAMPEFLVVGPSLRQTAIEITQSPVTSSAMQTNGNAFLQVIVSPFFTDANDWCLLTGPMGNRLRGYVRKNGMPELGRDPTRNNSLLLNSHVACVFGYDTFEGTFGAAVA